jgi:hypothetical protein
LADYCRAFCRALWAGFGRTDTSVIIIIVALFVVGQFTDIHSERHPPGSWVTILAIIFIVYEFLKTAYRLYANERGRREQLDQQRLPQLTPEQPNLAPTFKKAGPDQPHVPVRYVRVPIRNTSEGTATRCSARLFRIEFLDRAGWRPLAYNDTLDMAWANKPTADGSQEVDLAPDSVDTLDVVYVVHGSRELHLASVVPANYPGLMGLAGDYRFTFQLASTNAGSRTVRLRVHWDFNALVFPADAIEII